MDKESRLKVYFGPNDRLQVDDTTVRSSSNVSGRHVVKLADIIDPLCDAIDSDRTWLRDFRDDEVTISKDLYDVLLAYQKLRDSA